ncbi:hypothetical protein Cs7R123_45670 [Catellatospora sp. TT07R-123]|uniref:hypothetical protein n=1 Tax=Catellatospora sp. TT07R-123 TaxID=2733863 RepID=UPI001B0485B1|nr:hypothetical protein [Catellatospora sp. TT07R-123]GHJ47225.1 hypothetical protein Cs7R123_45670 [Catellatospora sp. TT07R-123]
MADTDDSRDIVLFPPTGPRFETSWPRVWWSVLVAVGWYVVADAALVLTLLLKPEQTDDSCGLCSPVLSLVFVLYLSPMLLIALTPVLVLIAWAVHRHVRSPLLVGTIAIAGPALVLCCMAVAK